MVRLRFSTEPYSLLAVPIRWRTMCKQSHVEFEDDAGFTLGSRFSLLGKISRWLNLSVWKFRDGVHFRPPEENKRQRNVIYATFPDIEAAYQWAEVNRIGQPYDVKAIMGIITSRGWYSDNAEFCSDLIDEAASAVGVHFLNNAPWATTPRDILISPLVTLLPNPVSESSRHV